MSSGSLKKKSPDVLGEDFGRIVFGLTTPPSGRCAARMSMESVVEGGFGTKSSLMREHEQGHARVLRSLGQLLDLAHPRAIDGVEEVCLPAHSKRLGETLGSPTELIREYLRREIGQTMRLFFF